MFFLSSRVRVMGMLRFDCSHLGCCHSDINSTSDLTQHTTERLSLARLSLLLPWSSLRLARSGYGGRGGSCSSLLLDLTALWTDWTASSN